MESQDILAIFESFFSSEAVEPLVVPSVDTGDLRISPFSCEKNEIRVHFLSVAPHSMTGSTREPATGCFGLHLTWLLSTAPGF